MAAGEPPPCVLLLSLNGQHHHSNHAGCGRNAARLVRWREVYRERGHSDSSIQREGRLSWLFRQRGARGTEFSVAEGPGGVLEKGPLT